MTEKQFSINKLNNFFLSVATKRAKDEVIGKADSKTDKLNKCKKYIENFFYPTTSGNHILIEDGNQTIISEDNMKTVYLIKWLADMAKGKQNKTCIFATGVEGTGKSTLVDFIREYVIGEKLYLHGKSDHLKGQHNSGMLGKLLVVFEELQIFSDKE